MLFIKRSKFDIEILVSISKFCVDSKKLLYILVESFEVLKIGLCRYNCTKNYSKYTSQLGPTHTVYLQVSERFVVVYFHILICTCICKTQNISTKYS